MDNRVDWVDYAKGIGIILVVYGHVLRGLHSAGFEFYGRFYELSDSIVYSFHMPLFFFLSGLFFNQILSKKGPKKLVFSKIDTIFYPYVLWSILQGSIEVFLSNYINGNITFNEVFSLLWTPRAQFWFLYYLFFIFVFFSLFLYVHTKIRTLFSFVSLIILYCIVVEVAEDNSLLLVYVIFFTFGMFFRLYNLERVLESKVFLVIFSILFFVSQYVYHFHFNLSYLDHSIYSLKLVFISVIFVFLVSLYLSKLNVKFISYLGGVSMAIYLMHILAGSGFRIVMQSFFEVESVFIHTVCGVLAGLLLPIVAVFIMRKLNFNYLFSAPISTFFSNLVNVKK